MTVQMGLTSVEVAARPAFGAQGEQNDAER